LRLILESPLLIPRVRNPGGSGGVRIELLADAAGGFLIRADGREHHAGTALAAAQLFNGEVRRAGRRGLTSRPEPVMLSAGAVERALGA
jgi:hypothetical protein